MKNILETLFVTGYPGGVAASVVHDFLLRDDVRIELLADGESAEAAQKEFSYAAERVNIVKGSIERIDFGLTGDAFHRLAREIDSILHLQLPLPPGSEDLGWRVRSAAREVVELALAANKLKHLVVLSHVDVSGAHVGKFAERDLEVGQRFDEKNQNDRFRAERIFRRFSSQLSITVVRTGWITGDGAGLCPFVTMLLSVDDVENIPTKYPGAPVYFTDLDSVVRVVVSTTLSKSAVDGETLHCIPSELPGVIETAKRFKAEMRTLLPSGFNVSAGARRALRLDSDRKQWIVKEFFKRQPGKAEICSVYSRGLVEEIGISMPTFDDEWIRAIASRVSEEITGFK